MNAPVSKLDLSEHEETFAFLREYYGRHLTSTNDLQATACCAEDTKMRFSHLLRRIPEEVVSRQYGCGSPIPDDDLTGLTIVDLGSGAGTDAFICAHLVGPEGRVIGVDMTDEQLEIARRHTSAVLQKMGLEVPNIEFRKDYIELLESIPDASVDLVISNCVINLSPRKDLVLAAIQRVLRPGGELHFSDIVCDRRLPPEVREDRILYSECLSGAEYLHDLHVLMSRAGFRDVREVSRTELADHVGTEAARFSSVTLRGFKVDLDHRCEDYGQFAIYKGTIPESPTEWRLDGGHLFERDRPMAVCRNTARMLSETRLAPHFEVSEERKHFGLFDCGPEPGTADATDALCC
jgi:arsenite methyltransferase